MKDIRRTLRTVDMAIRRALRTVDMATRRTTVLVSMYLTSPTYGWAPR